MHALSLATLKAPAPAPLWQHVTWHATGGGGGGGLDGAGVPGVDGGVAVAPT